jgi:hypothetical protein
METTQNSVMFATQEESLKIQALLRKNRDALNAVFRMELGHDCNVSDAEIIADALHSHLCITRKAIRLVAQKVKD